MPINPLQYSFFQNALIAGLLIASIAPLIGSFLITKKLSLISDTLAHVSLVGIVIGMMLSISPLIGALLSCLLGVLIIEVSNKRNNINNDSLLALLLSGSLSLTLTLSSIFDKNFSSLHNFFFGSINTIDKTELTILVVLAAMVGISFKKIYTKLLFTSFDEETAKAPYFNNFKLNLVFLSLTAITTITCIKIMGALLTGSLLILPSLASFKIAPNFKKSIAIAVAISIFSMVIGQFTSFYFEIPSGASITNILIICYIICSFFGRQGKSH